MDPTDSSSLKRKHIDSPLEPMKRPKLNLPTPQLACTPISIIKNKRLRPKKSVAENKTNISFFNSLLNEQRLLQTAPALKQKPISLEEKENKEATPSAKLSLKQPQTLHSSKENGLFFGRSLHVTGFVPNESSEADPKVEISADPNSSMSFGSYNNRILNYRLFTSPPKEQILRSNDPGL